MLKTESATVTVKGSAAATATASLAGSTGGFDDLASVTAFASASAAATGANSYAIEVEAVGDREDNGAGQIRFRVMNSKTGEISDWVTANVGSAGNVVNASAISTNLAGISEAVIDYGTAAATFGTSGWSSGDRALINVGGASAGGANTGSIQVGTSGTTIHITADLTNSATTTRHTLYTAQMDEAGKVYYGTMEVTLQKGDVVSGTASIDVLGAGDVASRYTKLSQLEQFTNADGRMLLDNTQEISIYAGNGKVAKVTLEGSDTVADLESKLKSALIDQLGMGADSENTNAVGVNNNLVKFVESKTTSGDRAVEGTFVIQGAVLG
ncbi:MAG: hypothetical protein K2N67_05810, partial [Mucispirillum sp.]|nr:hypothetical protein [Mucispirillum sp.]